MKTVYGGEAMVENKLCMGCMENKGTAKVCPHCGYADNTPNLPSYIAPETLLHDRYIVGRLLHANGQGASYIAYDTAVSCKVILNEYMPEGLCVRVKGKSIISVSYNNLAQYKALMAEYTELNKSLAKMRSLSSHLSPTLDLFAVNNTTYAVYEYIDGVKLVNYLKENAGELTWSEVSAMFPPLFTTLSLVHNAGVIHRGISPDTIYVTDKGELKLTDFGISSLRTVSTELKPEIFHGYAAPEQYSAASRQGTWTDVYAICAVLYRILTGSKPDPANERIQSDNLYTPQELNPNIPKHVSDVIMEGMRISGEQRIQTITELVTRLFDQPSSGLGQTMTISRDGILETEQRYNNDEYYEDEYDDYNDEYDDLDEEEIEGGDKISTLDRIKIPIIIGVLLIAIIMVIAIILIKLFTGSDTSRIREYSSVEDDSSVVEIIEETTEEKKETKPKENKKKMPDLIGQYYEEIKDKIEKENDIKLDADFEYNDEYGYGIIFWQEVKKGKQLDKGATIKVRVSKGTPTSEVPDYTGYELEEYKSLLDDLNIEYTEISEINMDYVNGYVIRVDPEPGYEIEINSGEIVTIYYASNPEPTEEPTEAPTEAPTSEPDPIDSGVDSTEPVE